MPKKKNIRLQSLHKIAIVFIMGFFFTAISAQKSAETSTDTALINKEQLISDIIQKMSQSDDVIERNLYNDSLILELEQFMEIEGAMIYDFQKLSGISILSPKSKNIVIMTWELANELDEIRYYGLITMIEHKSDKVVYVLRDSSASVRNAENAYMFANRWYGAIYYDVREVKSKGDVYYILLGLNRSKNLIKERIIEVLSNMGEPRFGKEVFNFSQRVMMKRLVYPHAANTDMSISFIEDGLIVMDHLSPSKPVYEGKFEYYVPDLSFDALRLKKGIWDYEEDFDAKLDKNLKDRYYNMELPEQKKIY